MAERQRGLGRGLSALMGEAATEAPIAAGAPAPAGVQRVPIESLKPNPDQPRKLFSRSDMEELAASIRDKGVLQPILVRSQPDEPSVWQIIAGERRWRASQVARLTEVPIVVREMDDVEVFEVAIIENVQRADLNPLEEANAYGLLIERHGRTQDEIAGIVGKSRSHVANTLRLLQLPMGVLNHVIDGKLTAGHARALITAPDPQALAEQVIREGMNVRQTEALARRAAEGPPQPKPTSKGASGSGRNEDIAALEQDLLDVLGLKVSIGYRDGAGEVVVKYASLEQLDDICRRLMQA
ncbi:ParB/RepB/Spo0J family partition protein [Brevundimonas sp. PAMC22021]|uniref:ParB/RepB/Spo0J family partition protein n=1 Tax=Brevundimonas sp. PAMC22021 TaxID=2861285 RepID=UPI001C62AF0B|nr:ParB/RepB/Spo0J family partition protein [Brevundimonas sp. PAMC22021]QYF86726.1 ParB/RepB/Spo0J family partition protein [Brevundimonas sp. PAMC22021]